MAQPNNEADILSEMDNMIEEGYAEGMNLRQLVKKVCGDLDLVKEEDALPFI